VRIPFLRAGRAVVLGLGLATSFSFAQQPSAPVDVANLASVRGNPKTCPAQVSLKEDVQLVITANGKQAGSMLSPAGSTVNVFSIGDTTIEVGVASARASVDPAMTDFWQRVNAAKVAPAAATNASPSIPATTSTVVAPPPTGLNYDAPGPANAKLPAPATVATAASPPAATTGPPVLLDLDIKPADNFTRASFRFWCPAYDQAVRGVIVMVPGLRGDNRGQVNDPAWQALARKFRLALVACCLQGPGSYYEANHGTGDALLQALDQFGQQAHRPELSTNPLLLYGESAGGQFDYDFVLWKPDRVMAFIVNKGGYYNGDEPERPMCSIPALFFLGLKDTPLRIDSITHVWSEGRGKGALWALTPQPNSGHEFSRTGAMARTFFDSVLQMRLPNDATVTDASQMKPVADGQGWTGDLATHAIAANPADADSDRKAAWLPDQVTAAAWKNFV
jgi:hypothetical protein